MASLLKAVICLGAAGVGFFVTGWIAGAEALTFRAYLDGSVLWLALIGAVLSFRLAQVLLSRYEERRANREGPSS